MISPMLRTKILSQPAYTPMQIYTNHFILNTRNRYEYEFILRLIRKGFLLAQNITPNGRRANYQVASENIIDYLENVGVPTK